MSSQRPPQRPPFRKFQARRFCKFCADKTPFIDYKNIRVLKSFLTEKGKIIASRMTNTCAKHQRELAMAIKRARNIALLPFVEK
ncbi:MAG TPA: 30S ribosomal protein S18 [Nitrospirae bacterium]|nr:30S ribosomal protein S18 [Nitrospirota bacterium]